MTACGGNVTITCGVQGPQGPPGPSGGVASVQTASESTTLTAAQSGTLFTNQGAVAEIDLTLPGAPSPFEPLTFTLLVVAAQLFGFICPAGVTITNGTDSTSAGGSIKSNAVGDLLTILMVSPTQWVIQNVTGLWIMA